MRRIRLIEIGELPAGLLESISAPVARELDAEIVRAPARLDPSFAYDGQRGQFYAARLLQRLRESSDGEVLTVGAASVDLFNPVLTFVFGEAEMPGRAAVFSLFRLREEFYGLPSNPRLLADRAAKEMLHEIGHALGLPHCSDASCVMSPSHAVEAVDVKGRGLCLACRARIARPA